MAARAARTEEVREGRLAPAAGAPAALSERVAAVQVVRRAPAAAGLEARAAPVESRAAEGQALLHAIATATASAMRRIGARIVLKTMMESRIEMAVPSASDIAGTGTMIEMRTGTTARTVTTKPAELRMAASAEATDLSHR